MSQVVSLGKLIHRAGGEGLQSILESRMVGHFVLEVIEFIIAIVGNFDPLRIDFLSSYKAGPTCRKAI